MKKLVIMVMVTLFATGSVFAQPRTPQRPPWGDVCCGGPCCVKAPKPR
jgi:hypothetical protein